MKLRLSENGLRLRLSKSDLARLAEAGRVSQRVTFPAGEAFDFELADGDKLFARLSSGSIHVTLPATMAKHWMDSDDTGIEAQIGPLHLLIEKDFQCAHRDAEQNADAFPNPQATL